MSFTSSWRDVYVVAGARAASICGDLLAVTALVLALEASGAGGYAVAALLLAEAVPLVLLSGVGGWLADRVDSRTLLISVATGQAAVCVALAYSGGVATIVALAAVLSAGVAVTQPTLPEMVSERDLPRATGLGQAASSVGMLIAPALGGLLVGQFGHRVPLLIDAVSFAAIAVAAVLIRTRRGGRRVATEPAAAGGAVPAWTLRSDPLTRAMIVATALVIAAVVAVNVIDVFYVVDTLGASTTTYGLVAAAWTAGMLPGAWLTGRLAHRLGRDDRVLVLAVLGAIGWVCVLIALGSTVPSAWWLVPLFLLGGVGNGALNVLSALVISRRVPADQRGRGFSRLSAAFNGANMIGYAVGGLLLAHLPPRPLVAACGIAGVLVALATLPVVRRAGRRTTVDLAECVTSPAVA